MKYLSLFLFSSILLAQAPQRIIYVNTDPSGSCNDSSALQWNPSSGNFSGCKSGTWGVIASGGGGGSPGGTTNSIQYYATSSTFGGITAPANGTPSFNVWNGSNTYVTEPWASIVGPSGYLSVPSPSCTGSFLCLDVVTALGTGLAAQNQ